VKVVFLGGPWHGQVHEIPDGTHHWEVPVTVTVGGDWPGAWKEVADVFQYQLVSYAMVPALASAGEVAELLRDHLRGGP
jgi:hypothetical protein